MAIPADAVHVDFGAKTASMIYTDAPVGDYLTLNDAVTGAEGISATVSFDVEWSGTSDVIAVRNPTEGFEALLIQSTATVSWSANAPAENFTFTSDPASTSTNEFSEFGVERNGVFFR